MDLLVRVKEITGNCPVYTLGDSFRLKQGYQLVSEKPLCMHALASLMPFYNTLRVGTPDRWGLASKDDRSKMCFQCPDPASHTGGGTAVFEVSVQNETRD